MVSSMVKVSVILPIYNEEKYLAKCLDSICGQTLKEIEIICVDDGSTDQSPHILEEYAKKDSRIKVISQKNQFAGAARNKGMACATGEYLSFLDADDYYASEMLEKMAKEAEKNRADIVMCRYSQCYEEEGMEEKQLNSWEFEEVFLDGQEVFSGRELLCAGIFQIAKGWAWDKLFRREFVKNCGYQFPGFRSSEDGFFVYMLMARAEKIAYRKEEWAVHRIRGGSLSNTKESDWKNGFTMWSLLGEELKRHGLYEIYEQSLINELLYFLLWYLESMKTFEAFSNCYRHIQSEVEREFKIMAYEKDFFFQKEIYDWYKEVMELPLAEYLFYHRVP